MLGPLLCGLVSQAPLLPKLRGHFAEFLGNASSVSLRILSSSTCVGLRYGHGIHDSGFSRRLLHALRYFCSLPVTGSLYGRVFPLPQIPRLDPAPSRARASSPCPHISDMSWCRNINLLSIGYAFRPRLRSRLPQGRSALPWNPWIFGLEDSHLYLATHSGILSSRHSTAPYQYSFHAPSMLLYQPTMLIPKLRCRVSAPDIFGAGPLD